MRVSLTRTIIRQRLLSGLRAGHPRLVAFVAPAGYGKSTLARQFGATFPASAICDCGAASTDMGFARIILDALAQTSPKDGAGLAQAHMALQGEAGQCLEIVVKAWRRGGTQPEALVFDNVERLGESPAQLLWQLIALTPEHRTVVLCSRTRLGVRLSRFAAPHDITLVSAEELAFDRVELGEVFAGTVMDAGELDRVAAMSRGWPIAVFLLLRFAREGRLRDVLEESGDGDLETLQNYLVTQVLDDLDPAARDGLIACALLPNATAEDVALTLDPRSQTRVNAMLQDLPFVQHAAEGVLSVHPLVAAVLETRYGSLRIALLERTARAWVKRQGYVRAAQLYLAAGNPEAAAANLDALDVLEHQVVPMASAAVMGALPREVIMRYPRLWYGSVLRRRYAVPHALLVEEAAIVWRSRPRGAPPAYWTPPLVAFVTLLSESGRHAEALGHLRAFEEETGLPDVARETFHGSVLHIQASILSRMGRIRESVSLYDHAAPVIAGKPVSFGTACVTRAATVERVRGNRKGERALLTMARDALAATSYPALLARVIAEDLVGAWLADEEDVAVAYAAELDRSVDHNGLRGFAFLAAAATGRRTARPNGTESPYWAAYGYLLLAVHESDQGKALACLANAICLADECGEPYVGLVCRAALAATDPDHADAVFARMHELAAMIEDRPPFDVTRCVAFGERFARRRERAHGLVELDVLEGLVHCDGHTVTLHEQERTLLLALAMRRRGVSGEELFDMLWPDVDVEAARSRFHVALHRLRKRLGRPEIVVFQENVYQLHPSLAVDLWTFEEMWLTLPPRHPGREDEEARYEALRERLTRSLCALRAREDPPWFQPVRRRIEELERVLCERAARRALQRGDANRAECLARIMTTWDECDESAWEILIRALVADGRREEAVRQYNAYRDILKRELEAQPNRDLERLLSL
jgi:DNA-binding SARP family transcriptional activator